MKTILTLSIFIFLLSCGEDKIKTSEGRFELPEPDKEQRINVEVSNSLLSLSKEIAVSDSIGLSKSGRKLINSGTEILRVLQLSFTDSTITKVYSNPNHRYLSKGELAILVADKIKSIPIARVVGVQQCTPPFDSDIESYLERISDNPEAFTSKYNEWRSTGGLTKE